MEEEMTAEQKPLLDKKMMKTGLALAVVIVLGYLAITYLPGLLAGFDPIALPGQGDNRTQMLVIGEPSLDLRVILDQSADIFYYQMKDPAALEAAPEQELAKYNVVLLDQHLGATMYEHSVSRKVGEAIENFVKTGGTLVVVMDSGIYRSGGETGTGVAADIVGWQANFGSIMPVECDKSLGDQPNCKQPVSLVGKIYSQDFSHKIMEGIEVAPADPGYAPFTLVTFDVKPTGNVIAQIKNNITSSIYPAIVEKKLVVGKVIYFNYDPAVTPGVWENTLEYVG